VAGKVVFCIPTVTKPYQQCLDSLAASIPLIQQAGWEELMANSIGCPYISRARETMLRKAMAAQADVVVFIDHDLSWPADALLRLLETDGDVVAGTYRFKEEPESYMGALITDQDSYPIVRKSDGCLKAFCVPAGFLKITRNAVNRFMLAYPELQYVDDGILTVDLFNHGAHKGVWYGEDYAFSRNWRATGGEIWVVPDLDLTHHTPDKPYPGNYHQYLLRQDGGSESDNPRC
jgi:glycosyltransferase involved in cell wall biosynthesis